MESLEPLVNNYQPSDEAIREFQKPTIILIAGIAGAGKNTVMSELLKTGEYYDLVTTVTREPRHNDGVLEQDGIDYHFITHDQAVEKLQSREYVEASFVHGRIYGLTLTEIKRANATGKNVIADITVEGVMKYKQLSDNILPIFLLPPNYHEWQRRIRQRYSSEEAFLAEWPRRRESAIAELEEALKVPYYHFVVNDNLSDAIISCQKIIDSHDTFYRKDDELRLVAREILELLKSSD